jgi:hypothetical protein
MTLLKAWNLNEAVTVLRARLDGMKGPSGRNSIRSISVWFCADVISWPHV